MTALELIKQAMREMGVLQTQEEPSHDEGQDMLSLFNNMLHGWQLNGIKLNHVDLILTSTVPYPNNHLLPFINNLAVEAGPQFGISPNPVTLQKAENGYRMLQNYYASPPVLSVDPALQPYYNPNRFIW